MSLPYGLQSVWTANLGLSKCNYISPKASLKLSKSDIKPWILKKANSIFEGFSSLSLNSLKGFEIIKKKIEKDFSSKVYN